MSLRSCKLEQLREDLEMYVSNELTYTGLEDDLREYQNRYWDPSL